MYKLKPYLVKCYLSFRLLAAKVAVYVGYFFSRTNWISNKSAVVKEINQLGVAIIPPTDEIRQKIQALLPRLKRIIDEKSLKPFGEQLPTYQIVDGEEELYRLVAPLLTTEIQQALNNYYKGGCITLGVSLVRSAPHENYQADSSWIWHHDGYPSLHLKLFYYLNDVTRKNGAFQFHPKPFSRKLFSLGFDGSYEGRFKVSSSIQDLLNDQERIKVLEGSFGTAFFANVSEVIHRAVLPEVGYREALIFEFFPHSRKSHPPRWCSDGQSVMSDPVLACKFWLKNYNKI